MDLQSLVFLFFTALLGGITSIVIKGNKQFIQAVVMIGGAYLLGFTITHLFPEIFLGHENHGDHVHEVALSKTKIFVLGICILGGILIQKGLEYLTTGIEHGHAHLHGLSKIKGVQILLGLVLHSLLEGSILINDHTMHHGSHSGLLIGIILHKTPAAFILGSMLGQVFTKRITASLLLLFALASPFGYILGHVVNSSLELPHEYFDYFFAVVAGNFIHIAYNVLTEADPDHKFSWMKWLMILIGFALASMVEFV